MNRWIKFWFGAWRSEPVVFVSPLSVRAARTALSEGSVSYSRAYPSFEGGLDGYRVVGRVGEDEISLEARQVGMRNSWLPVMKGRLEPAGTGSRLAGTLGWPPVVKAFSALWLSFMCCIFLVLVIRVVTLALRGKAGGMDFLGCLVPLGFVLSFVGLTSWASYSGRGNAKYLRSWLAERLQVAEERRLSTT
ncbi:hypothetical protein [Actinoplanes regularis]|uniref:hypothetical protein n=1 Tax=Actinoplanes regularis TaxID=52697 RepID=UPI0011776173|nr:hypothetical protein [Actinoplanes regularis]